MKKKEKTTAGHKLTTAFRMIEWYHSVLMWSLFRVESTPHSIILLIRRQAQEYIEDIRKETK